jgi:Fic family protein
MADESGGDRKSKAASPDLIKDPIERAQREAENGLRQFDQVLEMIEHFRDTKRPFQLRPSMILTLQRIAIEGISEFAGLTRPAAVEISGSKHQPPGAHLVPELLEQMCDYVNDHWHQSTALHLAAYIMWRLNWIHPFVDGNGRTSRAVSYLVLCVRLGYPLPGTHTIPEQIAASKKPYYDALEAADVAFQKTEQPDVSALEKLLEEYLSAQLVAVVEQATGGKLS